MTNGQREKDSETGREMLWITLFLLSVVAAGKVITLVTEPAAHANGNLRQAGGILVWIRPGRMRRQNGSLKTDRKTRTRRQRRQVRRNPGSGHHHIRPGSGHAAQPRNIPLKKP